jgi:hypothetical protein
MANCSHSNSALLCPTNGSESDASFEAKLIAAKYIRCRSTANKEFQADDQTAKCSSPPAIPAPKIWRRRSKKQFQDTSTASNLEPVVLNQFDISEEHLISLPAIDAEPTEMDEWAITFFSLVGLNEA